MVARTLIACAGMIALAAAADASPRFHVYNFPSDEHTASEPAEPTALARKPRGQFDEDLQSTVKGSTMLATCEGFQDKCIRGGRCLKRKKKFKCCRANLSCQCLQRRSSNCMCLPSSLLGKSFWKWQESTWNQCGAAAAAAKTTTTTTTTGPPSCDNGKKCPSNCRGSSSSCTNGVCRCTCTSCNLSNAAARRLAKKRARRRAAAARRRAAAARRAARKAARRRAKGTTVTVTNGPPATVTRQNQPVTYTTTTNGPPATVTRQNQPVTYTTNGPPATVTYNNKFDANGCCAGTNRCPPNCAMGTSCSNGVCRCQCRRQCGTCPTPAPTQSSSPTLAPTKNFVVPNRDGEPWNADEMARLASAQASVPKDRNCGVCAHEECGGKRCCPGRVCCASRHGGSKCSKVEDNGVCFPDKPGTYWPLNESTCEIGTATPTIHCERCYFGNTVRTRCGSMTKTVNGKNVLDAKKESAKKIAEAEKTSEEKFAKLAEEKKKAAKARFEADQKRMTAKLAAEQKIKDTVGAVAGDMEKYLVAKVSQTAVGGETIFCIKVETSQRSREAAMSDPVARVAISNVEKKLHEVDALIEEILKEEQLAQKVADDEQAALKAKQEWLKASLSCDKRAAANMFKGQLSETFEPSKAPTTPAPTPAPSGQKVPFAQKCCTCQVWSHKALDSWIEFLGEYIPNSLDVTKKIEDCYTKKCPAPTTIAKEKDVKALSTVDVSNDLSVLEQLADPKSWDIPSANIQSLWSCG